MVSSAGILVLAQQLAEPVLERLDPPRRAAVVMALLGLVLTGLLLVTIAMLGGHWARRLARHKPGQARSSHVDTARANRQLRESLQSILPEVETGDTIQTDAPSKETKAD